MSVKTIAELKTKFEQGDRPTAADFVDLIDSFLHAGLGNFPDPLPAVSAEKLSNIQIPNPLPARDAAALYNINPSEWTVLTSRPSYATATTYIAPGDQTQTIRVGQRLKLTIAGAPFYTEASDVAYDAGTNASTVTTADAMPGNQLTAHAVGVITPIEVGGSVSPSVIGLRRRGTALASAATLALTTGYNSFDVSGTLYITALSARAAGSLVRLYCTGNPRFVHSATLVLRDGRDYRGIVGDVIELESLGGGTWREVYRSAAAATGYAQLTLQTVADRGWILANDGTIGNAASGATTRANFDCYELFSLLWTNVSNTYAPLYDSAGAAVARGATGDADWNANCRLGLTRMLGRALAIAGPYAGSGLTLRSLGQYLGEEAHTQALGELVPHMHTITTYIQQLAGGAANNILSNADGALGTQITNSNTVGGGAAANVMQPTSFLNAMIKL